MGKRLFDGKNALRKQRPRPFEGKDILMATTVRQLIKIKAKAV
jgi:hypothetical protein